MLKDSTALLLFIGFVLGILTAGFLVETVDKTYGVVVWENNRVKDLCESLGTEPESYDNSTVTCKDGTEIYYRRGVK